MAQRFKIVLLILPVGILPVLVYAVLSVYSSRPIAAMGGTLAVVLCFFPPCGPECLA